MATTCFRLTVAVAISCTRFSGAAVHRDEENTGRPLKETMPWYRTTDELHQELGDLSSSCNGAVVEMSSETKLNTGSAAGQSVELDVLRIRKSSVHGKVKAMLVFGEHARELITGESALDFVRTLCGNGKYAAKAAEVLDNVQFTIIPNANPVARRLVEQGQYCKRTNEDGVDLNRNWGSEHREPEHWIDGDEMNPGPEGFSEPETSILGNLVESERPDIYLSVHSGAYLLGTPFGFDPTKKAQNYQSMMEVLQPISDNYCNHGQCPYGNLAAMIGYKNAGCDIDWVAEKNPNAYVFTWEIYVGEQYRDRFVELAQERGGGSFMQKSLREVRSKSQLRSRRTKDLQKLRARLDESEPENKQNVNSCIDQFLPKSQDETEQVVENWSGAYLDLANEVAKKQNAKNKDAGTKSLLSSSSSLNYAKDLFGSKDEWKLW